jgi:hypothetical protein
MTAGGTPSAPFRKPLGLSFAVSTAPFFRRRLRSVPGHQPLPIGMGRDGRSRRTGHGGRFTSREVVLRAGEHGEAPRAPRHLDPRERKVFRQLWKEPVAKLWEPGDAPLVALLAQMTVRLEDGAVESWVSARIMSLRSALFLSPRTRRRRHPGRAGRAGRGGTGREAGYAVDPSVPKDCDA